MVEALGQHLARERPELFLVERAVGCASATCQSRSGSASTQAGVDDPEVIDPLAQPGIASIRSADALAELAPLRAARRSGPARHRSLPVCPLIAADSRRRIWASSKLSGSGWALMRQ